GARFRPTYSDLNVQLAAQYASEAENARTEQQDAAGLRDRGAAIGAGAAGGADRGGFPAESTIAKVGSALPEVANRRTAATAVRDVPPLRAIGAGVGSIADGEPVGAAGCHE